MTRRKTSRSRTPTLTAPDRRFTAAIGTSVERLCAVAMAMLDDAVDAEGMEEAAQAFFASCEHLLDPATPDVNLERIVTVGGLPAAMLSALSAERALLGRPIIATAPDGQAHPVVPDDLDELGGILDDLAHLDPRDRAERYLADPITAALALGVHLARDGADEIFPLEPWTPLVLNRCLAAAAITAATLAAAELTVHEQAGEGGDTESEHMHAHRHADLDGLVHVAAAATDALDGAEREDLAEAGFGTIAQVVEDILNAAADLEPPAIHYLSSRLAAAFMRGFMGATPEVEIVESDDENVVRLLAGADLAGRLAAERLSPEDEMGSPFGVPPQLIH